jgi:hypothetical protein
VSASFLMALTALVSMIGSGFGVFIGMKTGLTRLETWRDIADQNIRNLRRDVNVLQDDSLVYDGEIDILYANKALHRAVRPRARQR